MTAMANNLKESIDALDFAVEKSMRYHQRRRGHYDFVHKFILFLTILSGSAAFGDLFQLSEYFGAAAALCAAIDLVWGLSHRARDHELLFRRFSELAIAIRSMNEPTDDDLAVWTKKRIEIESDEPPVFCALEADCDNEVRRAKGRTNELAAIDLWGRVTMNWLKHSQKAFELKTASDGA